MTRRTKPRRNPSTSREAILAYAQYLGTASRSRMVTDADARKIASVADELGMPLDPDTSRAWILSLTRAYATGASLPGGCVTPLANPSRRRR